MPCSGGVDCVTVNGSQSVCMECPEGEMGNGVNCTGKTVVGCFRVGGGGGGLKYDRIALKMQCKIKLCAHKQSEQA